MAHQSDKQHPIVPRERRQAYNMKKLISLLSAVLAVCAATTSTSASAQNVAAGEKKVAMCIGCHGIPGYKASFPELHQVPKISGQNAGYIAAALKAYRVGERKHPTMDSIAASLSDDDIQNIAAYYEQHGKGVAQAPHAPAEPSARVKEILANGTPVYERQQKAFGQRAIRTDSGRFFVHGNNQHMAVLDASGQPVWTHPVEGWGVQAIASAKRPWFPGQAVAQFDIIGHETAKAGDLGEFFVTDGNTGTWHIWTADGLLAGRLFQDLLGPAKNPWSMAEHQRGMDLTDVTVGQEHFSGAFCMTREDGKFYAVAGHNHISVVEVLGMDKFKRMGGTITVTKQDVAAALEWDRKREARKIYEAAKIIECPWQTKKFKLDGDPSEWESPSATLNGQDASLAMSYDDTNLYFCFRARGAGPLKNTGKDWRKLDRKSVV